MRALVGSKMVFGVSSIHQATFWTSPVTGYICQGASTEEEAGSPTRQGPIQATSIVGHLWHEGARALPPLSGDLLSRETWRGCGPARGKRVAAQDRAALQEALRADHDEAHAQDALRLALPGGDGAHGLVHPLGTGPPP